MCVCESQRATDEDFENWVSEQEEKQNEERILRKFEKDELEDEMFL